MFHHRNVFLAALALGVATPLAAQRAHSHDDCDDWSDWGERYCETREYTLKAGGLLRVDANPNGGITVLAWDRNEVKVVARISAGARTEADAKELAGEVRIETGGQEIHATGPEMHRHYSWSVSYEIWAPAKTDLRLSSTNGGLEVEGINGHLELETTNGGITLRAVSGDINAETTNGGINVALEGKRLTGEGLTARTTNGGVRLTVPDGFNADLEAETTNGGMDFAFPVTLQGRINKRISTKLGEGGPLIRLETTNGGVSVRRS